MKRAMFFTLINIILLALALTSVGTYYSFNQNNKAQLLSITVDAMQNMLDSTETDMSRATYIVSFRAILSMGEIVFNTNEYLTDVDNVFESLFFNGTYNANSYFLMENNTFPNWTEKAIANAAAMDFLMTINATDLVINQSDPWHVDVYVTINMSLRDTKNIAEINKTLTVFAQVPIEEFEDPMYNKETSNDIPNTIVISPWIGNFSYNNSLYNLQDHVNNSYYVPSTTAPSFLMRFEGDLRHSRYGIESFVDFQDFFDKTLNPYTPIENRSNIDHIYWNTSASYQNYTISGMMDWLRVDSLDIDNSSNRTVYYAVENYTN